MVTGTHDVGTGRDTRAWRVAARVLDPELPVVTIEDLGILRDVTEDDQGRVHVQVTPTYSGCPAMETIRTDLIDRLSEEGYLHVTVEFVLSPAWSTDQITAQGRARLEEYGVAPPPTEAERRQATGRPDPVGPLPAVRVARHPRVQPLRLHRLQVAVGVPCLPGALRPLQGPLMDFHPLRVARVDPLTDDAVAITFEVPDDLRDAYAFTPGQHLTIRGDDGERRSYSICVPPELRHAADRGQAAPRRRLQRRRGRHARAPATSST